MKTFNEAMECLKAQPGEAAVNVLTVRTEAGTRQEFDSENVPAEVRSLSDLCIEIGEDEKVDKLRAELIESHSALFFRRGADPESIFNMMVSLITVSLAYGVRVGIEMEKAEMPAL